MRSYSQIHKRLVKITKEVYRRRKTELDKGKAEYIKLKDDDFLWRGLLGSFATMGRSAGYEGLIKNTTNYGRVTYEVLDALSPKARERQVRETCHNAKIRMPNKKTAYILACYAQVKAMGGPLAAKKELLRCTDRDAKIAFLMVFEGIGKKYARNIMMDVYHKDFRDKSIAVDARIEKISEEFGLEFSSYEDHENFYLSVAADAGLKGWEMDRLLYNFQEDFLKEAQASKKTGTGTMRRDVTQNSRSCIRSAAKRLNAGCRG